MASSWRVPRCTSTTPTSQPATARLQTAPSEKRFRLPSCLFAAVTQTICVYSSCPATLATQKHPADTLDGSTCTKHRCFEGNRDVLKVLDACSKIILPSCPHAASAFFAIYEQWTAVKRFCHSATLEPFSHSIARSIHPHISKAYSLHCSSILEKIRWSLHT